MKRFTENPENLVNEDLKSWSGTDGGDPLTGEAHTEVDPDHEDFHDHDGQHYLPTQSEEFTQAPFLQFGAQFNTELSDPAAHADDLPADASFLSTIKLGPSIDFTYIDGNQAGFTDSRSFINTREYLSYTGNWSHQSQGSMLDDTSHASNGFTNSSTADFPVDPNHRPSIVIRNEEGRVVMPAAVTYHNRQTTDLETPTEAVHNAQALAYAFYAQWLPRMAAAPEIKARCMRYTPASLFRLGLRTLQECYRGALPSTFDTLFALMLVTSAFHKEKYQDSTSCDWIGFSRDIYSWHNALADISDRNLFVLTWHRLWCPGKCEIGLTEGSVLSNPSTHRASSTPLAVVEAPDGAATCVLPLMNMGAYIFPSEHGRFSMAKVSSNGLVMAGCSRFLDAVQFRIINERNAREPHGSPWNDASASIESVIQTLQQCFATVQFPALIANIIDKLGKGSIRSIRELEITLTSSSELSRLPLQDQRTYLDHVIAQCNISRNQYSSDWRSKYYIATLSDVMRLSQYSGLQYEPISSMSLQNESTSRMSDRQAGYFGISGINHNGVYAHNYNHQFTTTRPPLPPVAFRASVDDNHPRNYTSDTRPPTLQSPNLMHPASRSVVSSDFISDDSPSSSQSITEPSCHTTSTVTTCELCPNKTFEGAPQNRRRNLRRHMFSDHGLHPKLDCPAPRCPVTFKAGRKDNLKRHVELKHPQIVLPPNYFKHRNLTND